MPSNRSQLLALNIYDTFYGRAGWEGAGQAKAVVFCLIVVDVYKRQGWGPACAAVYPRWARR